MPEDNSSIGMRSAWQSFLSDIENVRFIGELYIYLKETLKVTNVDLSDLLRIQVVNTLSAFDRLMHEYVRQGLLSQLLGENKLLKKTESFSLGAKAYLELGRLGDLPEEQIEKYEILSRRVTEVLRTMTFQAPDKISDALSYVWEEAHKWQVIAKDMGFSKEDDLKQQIKLYVERRNQIVHEADADINGARRVLDVSVVQDCISIFQELGRVISQKLGVIP